MPKENGTKSGDRGAIRRKNFSNLSSSEKYELLVAYINMKEDNKVLAARFSISADTLTNFIDKFYKALVNSRETKLLIRSGPTHPFVSNRDNLVLDPSLVNKEFLSLLSNDEEPLTDNELLFCEYLLEYGDTAKALRSANLHQGLKSNKVTKKSPQYTEAMRLRAFYLKKKRNIKEYLNTRKRERLLDIDGTKDFVQENLVTIIKQIQASEDHRLTPSLLKALETLGRSEAIFSDKLQIESTNGDQALQLILDRAKEAKKTRELLTDG